jgi:outer membrane murein-binding lipoprotein Lpp
VRSRTTALVLGLVLLAGCRSTPSPMERREIADLRARAEEAVHDRDACKQAVREINEALAEAQRRFDAAALSRFRDPDFTGDVMVPVGAASKKAELAEGYCGDFEGP